MSTDTVEDKDALEHEVKPGQGVMGHGLPSTSSVASAAASPPPHVDSTTTITAAVAPIPRPLSSTGQPTPLEPRTEQDKNTEQEPAQAPPTTADFGDFPALSTAVINDLMKGFSEQQDQPNHLAIDTKAATSQDEIRSTIQNDEHHPTEPVSDIHMSSNDDKPDDAQVHSSDGGSKTIASVQTSDMGGRLTSLAPSAPSIPPPASGDQNSTASFPPSNSNPSGGPSSKGYYPPTTYDPLPPQHMYPTGPSQHYATHAVPEGHAYTTYSQSIPQSSSSGYPSGPPPSQTQYRGNVDRDLMVERQGEASASASGWQASSAREHSLAVSRPKSVAWLLFLSRDAILFADTFGSV